MRTIAKQPKSSRPQNPCTLGASTTAVIAAISAAAINGLVETRLSPTAWSRDILLGRKILEFRVLPEEGQLDRSCWAVTLLADNDFGLTFVVRIGVVVLVAIDEKNEVGILLNGAGFAQVGPRRALVGTLFQRTVELRKRDHGDVQFLCERLQSTRNF